MRGGRARVGLYGLFKALDGAHVIKRIDSAFAGQKMRILLLVQRALAGVQTTAQSHAQAKQQQAVQKPGRARHRRKNSNPCKIFKISIAYKSSWRISCLLACPTRVGLKCERECYFSSQSSEGFSAARRE